MTIHEAYIYVFGLLNGYWEKTKNVDLSQILSEMTLWHPLSWQGKSADPAIQHDWLKAVQKITNDDSLNDTQAIQAAYYFLKEYNDNQGFDFKDELAFLSQKIEKHIAAEKTWKRNKPTG
jgi:hypothetical protein